MPVFLLLGSGFRLFWRLGTVGVFIVGRQALFVVVSAGAKDISNFLFRGFICAPTWSTLPDFIQMLDIFLERAGVEIVIGIF